MSLKDKLNSLNDRESSLTYLPERFDGASLDDIQCLNELLNSNRVIQVHDTIYQQLTALVRDEHPELNLSDSEVHDHIDERTAGIPLERYGTWFYYPWTGRLVHLLPEDDYNRLRTSRNKYKITPEEQRRLAEATIGIVGLSVGRAATACLTLEGVGGELRLADFDHLELSNLNRLRHSVDALGQPKSVLAAREVLEIDPYRRVRIFPEGIHAGNLDRFMDEGGGIAVLVEECDSLDIKVRLREAARARQIPVVMDTSDRGMLDIERFDLEPDRPLLHGLLGEYRANDLTGLTNAEKVPLILRILGGTQMSPRMAASLTEVDETTTSWPQLASDVALGGALVCHAARKIVLGQALSSGRYYIDLNEQLRQPHPVHVPVPYKPHPDAMEPRALPELTVGPQRTLTRELLETWMAWGTSAPSPHNHQGWAFCFESGELHCAIDESRVYTGLDTEATASILAVGCAVENIVLAAQATGFSTAVRETGTTPRVATLTFTPSNPRREYIEEMRTRITNRRTTAPAPISADAATALQHVAITGQCELHLLTDQNKLKVLAELARQAGRLMFLQPQAYSEIVDGIRIGAKEVALGDGIDVETMDSTAKDIAALSLIRHAPVGAALREIGLGSALGNAERDAFLTASAAGLLILPGDDTPNAFFRGGRVFQRVWLEATRLGLAIHPVSNLPWMFRRVDRMQGRGFSPEAREFLRTVRPTFDSLFPASKGARLGLLRISSASRPAARTLRRPLSDVFVWSGDDG